MVAKKPSVTLHPDIAAGIAAARQGESVSAWIEQAARSALRRDAGLAAVDDWEREHGAFTPEEIARADAILREDFGPDVGR